MFKLAVIRDDEDAPCPFGLAITHACYIAGDSIDEMQAIDEDADDNREIVARNMEILEKNVEPKKCKYAAHLFKNKTHVVDCNFGEADAGISQNVSFLGSPYYTQTGEGLGIGGLINYPVTYQTDDAAGRNMYYGMSGWATRKERLLQRKAILNQAFRHY
jgi:hypothetical protein